MGGKEEREWASSMRLQGRDTKRKGMRKREETVQGEAKGDWVGGQKEQEWASSVRVQGWGAKRKGTVVGDMDVAAGNDPA